MRFAYLVALREYAENARTKGFWLGIFLLPVILFLSIQAPIWLHEKGTPVRHFVLVDQSAVFDPVVEAALENLHQTKVLTAVKSYAHAHATNGRGNPVGSLEEEPNGAVDSFLRQGGAAGFLQKLSLKPGAPAFVEPRRAFERVKLPAGISPDADLVTVAEALKPYLLGKKKMQTHQTEVELSAAILIPQQIESQIVRRASNSAAITQPSPARPDAIQFWSVNTSDSRLREEIEKAINSEVRRREYVAKGMDLAAVRQVEQTFAPLQSLNPKKEKGKQGVSQIDVMKQWAPSGFVYLLWLSIFVIVQMLLNNTIEEKSNRIIEVLLSSVTPGELMMGKLFGIAAIGLTMVGAWMGALFLILSWKSGGTSELAGNMLILLKGSNLVPMFSLYFLLGYLMYAAFILSIGSVCNTIKEAQSYMAVLTMVMMVPLLTMTFIPKDPNGPLARVLSWIPIYTPFTMMNRAAADPSRFDLIGTFVLLLVTTGLALWLAGKIFRVGILRTGQPPRILEMLAWVRRKD